jgi:hypothetical protein
MSIYCWGLISYEVVESFCCTEEQLEGLHYQCNIDECDGALYKTAFS